ncbi:hypothetical protein ACU635_06685 [[Actinomadura] parvosata]|uniref:hypothetical protein n=1 Tax=[Actinomadura] parvosata TaxID=1955412 RepID=UPI00406D0BB5
MNDSGLSALATSLWSAVQLGGAEPGEEAEGVVDQLWRRLREHRRRKGFYETPVNREELYLSLLDLLLDEDAARSLVARFEYGR